MIKKSVVYFIMTLAFASIMSSCRGESKDKSQPDFPSLTAQQVKSQITDGKDLILLDIRTPAEYNGPLGHIEGSILIPLQELSNRYVELDRFKDRQIIVYCRSGNRSRAATRLLVEKGFDAYNMLGGIKVWNKLKQK